MQALKLTTLIHILAVPLSDCILKDTASFSVLPFAPVQNEDTSAVRLLRCL